MLKNSHLNYLPLILIFLFSFSLTSAQVITATTTTFDNGNGTNDWSDPLNWTAGIPTSTGYALIGHPATIPPGYAAEAFMLASRAELTISAGASLTLGDPTGTLIPGFGWVMTIGIGALINSGTLIIETPTNSNGLVLTRSAELTNTATGVMRINVGGIGIVATGRPRSGGPNFDNAGQINIGPLGTHAISLGGNSAINQAGGQINTVSTQMGISAPSGYVLTNNGIVSITITDPAGTPVDPNLTIAGAGALMISQIVPTLSEWAMIMLALLMGVMATLALSPQLVTVGSGQGGSMKVGSGQWAAGNLPFEKKLFAKMLAIVFAVTLSIFAVAIIAFGYELTGADAPGLILAAPLMAYLLHLWVKK